MLPFALAAALLSPPVAADVQLPAQPAPLHGTYLAPEGPARTAAVIIAGSGPTDRDGNSSLGVRGGVYRQLAEGLADRGVATLRYDKRGVADSAPAGLDESALTFDAYIADARAWAAFAADRAGLPCVWLIGHSEGALIAEAAAQDNDAVCGLVLLSPVGERAGAALRRQIEAGVPEPLKAQALVVLDELEAGRTAPAPAELAALFRPSVQPYLISYFRPDPAALLAAYDRPVMLGHGSTDIQVPPSNSDLLATAQPRAHRVIFEGVNHILRHAPSDRAANVAAYGDAAIPLAPELVPAVADFILAQSPAD